MTRPLPGASESLHKAMGYAGNPVYKRKLAGGYFIGKGKYKERNQYDCLFYRKGRNPGNRIYPFIHRRRQSKNIFVGV
ncbi:MAG: hypothetical protein LBB73_06675 [Dysgonamonadaceae bacterium]|jgi:hypothetical protein|nr:hypothetical protein [Dysgonamonadaceae bacterium]